MALVRLAKTGADISHVVSKVIALKQAISGPQDVDVAHTGAHVARLMQSPSGVVYVSAGGFIAAEVGSTIINPAPIAFEQGWYATDGSGLRLLAAFEKWADDMGCTGKKLSTAAMAGPLGKLLERKGYAAAEMAWFK